MSQTDTAPNWPHGDDVYSNFDHQLETDVAERAMREDILVGHAAWDFHGTLWFDKDKHLWHDIVKVYGVVRAHLTGETIEDVVEQANQAFGSK